jgi:hypothetical protein
MTRDPRTTPDADAFDDDAIAQLVRDAAGDWAMPAVRLDAPAWRGRIRSPRARRVAATRGWFGRVGQAASAAVALTVAGALIAVVLTRPSSGPGKTSSPTSGSTPGATQPALASPLPKLVIDGEAPDPSTMIVLADPGQHRIVDLAKGEVGGPASGAGYGSRFRLEPDGSMLCLCLAESTWVGESPTVANVSLSHFAADGSMISSTPIETFTGQPDPRDVDHVVPEQPPHVLTALAFSADGKYGFVGWSVRAHPVWKSGMLVVELDHGAIVSRLVLPDQGTGEGDARRVVDAPAVVGDAPFLRVAIARSSFGWHPVTSSNAIYDFESALFDASFKGGDLTGAAPVVGGDNCGEVVTRAGVAAGGGTWLVCSTAGSSSTVVRRLARDGSLLGDTRVMGRPGIEGDMTALSADGSHLYVWNPATATLTRVDLATGETATGQAPIPAATTRGPLAALGDWLAPTAAAKSFLQGALVVSPDGSKVYAIGVSTGATDREPTGSSGVFVFDAVTMASVDQWEPTADFVSLALSADGRFVYAAGMPGVEASGRENRQMEASITVFDALTGSPRLIAGQLGSGLLLFESPTFD